MDKKGIFAQIVFTLVLAVLLVAVVLPFSKYFIGYYYTFHIFLFLIVLLILLSSVNIVDMSKSVINLFSFMKIIIAVCMLIIIIIILPVVGFEKGVIYTFDDKVLKKSTYAYFGEESEFSWFGPRSCHNPLFLLYYREEIVSTECFGEGDLINQCVIDSEIFRLYFEGNEFSSRDSVAGAFRDVKKSCELPYRGSSIFPDRKEIAGVVPVFDVIFVNEYVNGMLIVRPHIK